MAFDVDDDAMLKLSPDAYAYLFLSSSSVAEIEIRERESGKQCKIIFFINM